jgi:ATP-dependent HslUV protease ATP-binding subunit HslU
MRRAQDRKKERGILGTLPGDANVVFALSSAAPNGTHMQALTPKEIVAHLDQYIVGQHRAKRAVAVALRNRWRRRQLSRELQDDVYPKNILLIGPTGVGKTEIARRLASMARAPFIKVEASRFSEVGYHGRDVESMVRDLVESAIAMVRLEKAAEVRVRSRAAAEERILAALYREEDLDPHDDYLIETKGGETVPFTQDAGGLWAPVPGRGAGTATPDAAAVAAAEERRHRRVAARDEWAERLRKGALDDREIQLEVADRSVPTLNITSPQGTESMGIDARAMQEIWGRQTGPRTKIRKLSVGEASRILEEEEADKLIDQDELTREALERAEHDGIIFLDEIDKIIGTGENEGPNVSREGVQRDLLPIVEGATVFTKHGYVKSDHVLFVAAGAFHFHKPSELIPELQGRFPIRVALSALTEADFVRILKEPRNALTRQYQALLAAEGVELTFTDDGLKALAAVAFKANRTTQNIGARRLMTVLEKLLEDLSFDAPDMRGQKVVVDARMVREKLGDAGDDDELIPYQM